MSFNRQILSGFAGNVDIDRQLVHAAGVYQMQQADDVIVQSTGADVLLPVARPATPPNQPGSDLTIDLLYIIQADTLPCVVQGGPNTINGAASLTIPGNSFAQIIWDGNQWLGALSGGTADGPLAGDVTGAEGDNTVVRMQKNPIDAALLGIPDAGKLLQWTGTEWQALANPGAGNLGQVAEYVQLTQGTNNSIAPGSAVDYLVDHPAGVVDTIGIATAAGPGAQGTAFNLPVGTYLVDWENSNDAAWSLAIYQGVSNTVLAVDTNTIAGASTATSWIHGRAYVASTPGNTWIMVSPVTGTHAIPTAGTAAGDFVARITFLRLS